MSEPEPESPPSAAPRLLVAARIVVPLALALVGYSVLIAQRWSVDHELQLVAPEVADPAAIPIRSYLFGGITGVDEAGELVDLPVEVELVCGRDTVARRTLEIGALHSAETVLRYGGRRGDCVLRGTARDHLDVVATVERPIRLVDRPPVAPLRGRIAGDLQHIHLGPVVLDAPDAVAPRIDVRVTNGTCVPDQRCEVLIAAPDVDALTVEHGAAVTLVDSALEAGLHVVTVVAHGPEAAITLVASRGGARVAHAELQLPIALATPWFSPSRAPYSEEPLRVIAPPGRSALIVDAFVAGRWTGTRTLTGEEVPLDELVPGEELVRLQARVDPFGGEYVGVHHVSKHGHRSPSPWARTRELLEAEGIELTDPPDTDWRLLLASAEEEIRQLPAATSGLEADRARLAARQRTVQIVGAVALALGIVVFLLSLLRRGLRAAQEARDVMTEAGDETATSRATRVRMTIAVIAFVGAVAVALLAGAALVLARAALVP